METRTLNQAVIIDILIMVMNTNILIGNIDHMKTIPHVF